MFEQSTKQVYKSDTKATCTEVEINIFRINSFEQQDLLPNAFLNQGELDDHCQFIGMNGAYFNSQCLSNAKRFFSEMLSPKIMFQ